MTLPRRVIEVNANGVRRNDFEAFNTADQVFHKAKNSILRARLALRLRPEYSKSPIRNPIHPDAIPPVPDRQDRRCFCGIDPAIRSHWIDAKDRCLTLIISMEMRYLMRGSGF